MTANTKQAEIIDPLDEFRARVKQAMQAQSGNSKKQGLSSSWLKVEGVLVWKGEMLTNSVGSHLGYPLLVKAEGRENSIKIIGSVAYAGSLGVGCKYAFDLKQTDKADDFYDKGSYRLTRKPRFLSPPGVQVTDISTENTSDPAPVQG